MTTARPRATPRKKAALPKPYHHGSLHDALLVAAETVLLRDGISGLALRNIAREAGVSAAAPKHHFGDTTGLLSELAAIGFRRLGDVMASTMKNAPDERTRRNALGRAYLRFAYENAGMFGLMFRNEIINMEHPALKEAAASIMDVMVPVIEGKADALKQSKNPLSRMNAMRVTAAWAFVHGLATLLIDHRLGGILKATSAFDDPVSLVDVVLEEVRLGLDNS
ncbi:TetR/AcrR family transcriptional regulator [Variovorax sp. EL159]|uniref:TetR/AcrR family transcriptional regulator n=1 Tax=Variovorax sp. EL159 TaxID=1566270 RepID=UPI00087F7D43|nr:WHG domain-containing protein [Variovorax sp. EL159]SCX72571.1 transcriptional regulator, TetR family [Variovorax sp. EL159]